MRSGEEGKRSQHSERKSVPRSNSMRSEGRAERNGSYQQSPGQVRDGSPQ